MSTSVSVLGGGSWGTTVAHLIAINGHRVRLYCRNPETADEINSSHRNSRYLENVSLSENIEATTDIRSAVVDMDMIVVIIPSKALRGVCREIGELVTPDQFVVHGTKGIERGTHLRMSEVIRQETCAQQIGVLSGPNIAAELVANKPAGTVIASKFPRLIARTIELLSSDILRVYGNPDVVGVELGGTLKNIVAIASGMAAELQLGENAKALLITRGLSEISQVAVALGASPMTFLGLAGIGDLVVTCSSSNSRNYRVGRRLARGENLDHILNTLGMVAEGVNTAQAVYEISEKFGLDTPMLTAIYRVLHENMAPQDALLALMRLDSRPDVRDL